MSWWLLLVAGVGYLGREEQAGGREAGLPMRRSALPKPPIAGCGA